MDATVNGMKTVRDKTTEGFTVVVDKTGEGFATVRDKTSEGLKTVGDKAGEGFKNMGSTFTGGAPRRAVPHRNRFTRVALLDAPFHSRVQYSVALSQRTFCVFGAGASGDAQVNVNAGGVNAGGVNADVTVEGGQVPPPEETGIFSVYLPLPSTYPFAATRTLLSATLFLN